MGKKKKKKPVEAKPWCFYCEREFADETTLVQHQKAKHFKCPVCHRRFTNAPGMNVHMQQVHKKELDKVPNALEDRDDPSVEVSGSRGIPYTHEAVLKRLRVYEPNHPALQAANAMPGVNPFAMPPPSGMPPPITGGLPPGLPPPGLPVMASSSASMAQPKDPGADRMALAQPKDDKPEAEKLHDLEGLVYRIENYSMEEKRAMLEKYRYDEAKMKAQLSDLDAALGARLSQYINA